jgi:uncharacterized protein (TIGR02284 family)
MSTSMKNADTVQDLVRIANDGAEFYGEAMDKTENPQLRNVFGRMREHKQRVASALRVQLRHDHQDAPEDGTVAGSLRQTYAELRAKFSSNDDKIYVAQLEQSEDRLLKHFQSALDEVTDPAIKALLQTHAPQVRACHDEMRALKKTFNA